MNNQTNVPYLFIWIETKRIELIFFSCCFFSKIIDSSLLTLRKHVKSKIINKQNSFQQRIQELLTRQILFNTFGFYLIRIKHALFWFKKKESLVLSPTTRWPNFFRLTKKKYIRIRNSKNNPSFESSKQNRKINCLFLFLFFSRKNCVFTIIIPVNKMKRKTKKKQNEKTKKQRFYSFIFIKTKKKTKRNSSFFFPDFIS